MTWKNKVTVCISVIGLGSVLWVTLWPLQSDRAYGNALTTETVNSPSVHHSTTVTTNNTNIQMAQVQSTHPPRPTVIRPTIDRTRITRYDSTGCNPEIRPCIIRPPR